MLKKIKNTIKRFNMFESGQRVLVAVSGGPDSVALLHVLNSLSMDLCVRFSVAHLDHGLRKDSKKDLLFVRRLSNDLGLPFHGSVIPKKILGKIKKSASVENSLRNFRYHYLLELCRKKGFDVIATGHTKDDQAETVLMRILRGSGLGGLSAILPKRLQKGILIVRPLLFVRKEEILRYLKINKLRYRIDSTNSEDYFFRNKVRNKLLPLLRRSFNPNIIEVLSGLGMTVGADYDYLMALAEKFIDKELIIVKKGYKLRLESLKLLDVSLRRLVVRGVFESISGEELGLSFSHLQEAEGLIFERPDFSEVHLPCSITLLKSKSYLHILKR